MAKQKYQKDAIINYETMGGWPIYKMNIAQILEEIGCKLNSETGMYEISKDDAILDVYPILYEDDAMGYGVNEQYITEVSCSVVDGEPKINMFRDTAINNAPLWTETHYFYYAFVAYGNKEGYTIDIRKNKNNEIEILFENCKNVSDTCWVKPEELVYAN